jgi:hypothetical protein
VDLYRSGDAGHSWVGPFPVERGKPQNDFANGIYLSPAYGNDHTLYVSTFDSVGYVSTDSGAHFTPLSGTESISRVNTTPFLNGEPGVISPRADLIVAETQPTCCDMIFDPLLPSRPTAPDPQVRSWSYIVPATYPSTHEAVMLSQQLAIGPSPLDSVYGHARAYGCTGDFVCTSLLYDFPPFRSGDTGTGIEWDAPTYAPSSPDNYAVITSGRGVFEANPPTRVYRSADYGHTWTVWSSVTKLLSAFGGGEEIFVNASPDAPHRLFLHLTGGANPASIPDEQLYRSDDNGVTWRRIGVAWGPQQKARSRSNLPWNATPVAYGTTIVEPGGRLYLVGEHDTGKHVDHVGLYCSRDYGTHWSASC